MDNFEHLKHIWQKQPVSKHVPDIRELQKSNADNQRKLEREQIRSGFWLLITSIILTTSLYLIWVGFFFEIRFHSTLTYSAIILVALLSALQGFINISIYLRLRQIDVTTPAAQHLSQWQRYYAFRKRLVRVNTPIYYVLLNGAFSLYFIEILSLLSPPGRVIALSLYIAGVLYAYLTVEKQRLRKEFERLEAVINNLQQIEQQLSDEPETIQ